MGKRSRARRNKQRGKPKPRTPETPRQDTNGKNLAFGLHTMCQGFRISNCAPEFKLLLADEFEELSQLNWNQIYSASRYGKGSENIPLEQIKVAIPARITPDTTILSFHISDRGRLIGFRDGHVFQVVWVDEGHRVYAG